jgi:hypothetical protein
MKFKNPICAPSTVNWCEHDYVQTPYVAEFWNTVTGVFILISAVYWYITQLRRDLGSSHKGLVRIFQWMVVVSIGTCLFHGTLLYKYQLLDEMPMLIISREYLALLTNLETAQNSMRKRTLDRIRSIYNAGGIIIYIIPFTYFVNPLFQVATFHITLKVFETIDIALLANLSLTLNKTMFIKIFKHTHTKGDNLYKYRTSPSFLSSQLKLQEYINYKRRITYHTKRGIFLYSSSIILWVIERLFCDYVQSFQLHAWWHVLSSIGMYHLNMIVTLHVRSNNIT